MHVPSKLSITNYRCYSRLEMFCWISKELFYVLRLILYIFFCNISHPILVDTRQTKTFYMNARWKNSLFEKGRSANFLNVTNVATRQLCELMKSKKKSFAIEYGISKFSYVICLKKIWNSCCSILYINGTWNGYRKKYFVLIISDDPLQIT